MRKWNDKGLLTCDDSRIFIGNRLHPDSGGDFNAAGWWRWCSWVRLRDDGAGRWPVQGCCNRRNVKRCLYSLRAYWLETIRRLDHGAKCAVALETWIDCINRPVDLFGCWTRCWRRGACSYIGHVRNVFREWNENTAAGVVWEIVKSLKLQIRLFFVIVLVFCFVIFSSWILRL